jgi:hypothetical protein
VNPPWSSNGDGSAKDKWLSKARSEAKREAVDSVVMILPSDTSAGWFHEHVLAAPLVCFYGPGRLSFKGADRNPSFGLLLMAYGDDAKAYREPLNTMGTVVEGRTVFQSSVQQRL